MIHPIRGRLTRSLLRSHSDGLRFVSARIPADPVCETTWPASAAADAPQLALRRTVFALVKKSDNRQPVLEMRRETAVGDLAEPRGFDTTHWSLILSAAGSNSDEQKTREALAELCRTYWRPAFVFVSRQGYSVEEAQDLTQDFFAMILESNWLRRADEHRGRFRSFLLKSLQNFLSHADERTRAVKRGGRMAFVSWDEWMAEAPSQVSVPAETLQYISAGATF